MKYERGMIIGTANTAFQCAERLVDELPVTVFENSMTKFPILSTKCKKAGIKCLQADKAKTMTELAGIVEPTIVFSVLNTFLFPSVVVENPNLTIINYHNALLPKFPGRNAEAWAIYEGERESGFTWHYIDESVDGGEMITQGKVIITSDMTAGELFALINEQALLGFSHILPDILNDAAPRIKLNTNKMDIKFSYDIPNRGIFETSWNYEQASRFLRSMDFGIFPQFPQPVIMIEDVRYSWKKYILDPTKKAEKFSYQFIGGDLELLFQDGRIKLVRTSPVNT